MRPRQYCRHKSLRANGPVGNVVIEREDGNVIFSGETLTGVSGSGCTVSINTDAAYCAEGYSKSLKVVCTTPGTINVAINLGVTNALGQLSMANGALLSLTCYSPKAQVGQAGQLTETTSKVFVLAFEDPGTFAKYARWQRNVRKGWNSYNLSPAYQESPSSGGNVVNLANINYLRFDISNCLAGEEYYLQEIRYGVREIPTLVLGTDDGEDDIELIAAYFHEDGDPMVHYLIRDQVGVAGYMTTAGLQAFATWISTKGRKDQFSDHCRSNEKAITDALSQAELETRINDNRDWLRSVGLAANGSEYYKSANNGEVNQAQYDACVATNCKAMRLASWHSAPDSHAQGIYQPMWRQPAASVSDTSFGAGQITDYLNRVMAEGADGELIFHELDGGNPSVTISTANITLLRDEIRAKKRQGLRIVTPIERDALRMGNRADVVSFTPTSHPRCIFAHDFTDLTKLFTTATGTTTPAVGGNIGRCEDVSGLGVHVRNSTAAKYGLLDTVTIGSNTFYCIKFTDATERLLYSADGSARTSWSPTKAQPLTLGIVYQLTTDIGADQALMAGGASTEPRLVKLNSSPDSMQIRATSTLNAAGFSEFVADYTTVHLLIGVFDGTRSWISLDGDVIGGSVGGTDALSSLTYGNVSALTNGGGMKLLYGFGFQGNAMLEGLIPGLNKWALGRGFLTSLKRTR